MSGGRIPKKWDFYSSGRGMDYYNDDSMEEASFSSSQTREEESNSSNPSYDTSSPSVMYGIEDQSHSPAYSPPPLYPRSPSPAQQSPSHYNPDPHVPTHSVPSYNIQSNLSLYMSPSNAAQAAMLPSSSSHLGHMYQQIGPIPGVPTGHPMYPEPPYGNFVPADPYSPLRPMNTNGIHGVAIGLYEPSSTSCRPEGAAGISGLSDGQKKKRKQECSLCLNHNQHVEVRGHKWFCPHRKCPCERCEITRGRQHHMKEQQKLTRSLNRNTSSM